jgi:hypothetical protein
MFKPSIFLKIISIVLILIAIIGFIGLINLSLGNWIHLLAGIIAIIGAFTFNAEMQKWLTLIFACAGIAIGVYGIYSSDISIYGNIMHFVLAIWALMAGLKKPKMIDPALL